MILRKLAKGAPEVDIITKLNFEAFPIEEHTETDFIYDFEKDSLDLLGIYLKEAPEDFAGYFLCIKNEKTVYISYFAILPEKRNLGIGTKALEALKEYYDGKQIIRAGLEDHFCAKLLGLPMGCDICYTNHAEADQNDMDVLMTCLAAAGLTYQMAVPGGDDVMLGYQTTSFHDIHYVRQVFGKRPAPEFEAWLEEMDLVDARQRLVRHKGGSYALVGYQRELGR